MNLHIRRSLAIAIVANAAGLGCNKDLVAPEPLPETLATVQAAVDMVTTGQRQIVGNCLGSVPVNCPAGQLASPVNVTLTRTADTVAFVVGQDRYDFSATMSAVSAMGIPITIPGTGACTLNIDTNAGTSPTITLSGSIVFTSQTLNGPIDRLDFYDLVVTGLETGDGTISGSVACAAANFGLPFFITQLQNMFVPVSSLCSVPGPALLQPCPTTAVSTIQGVPLARPWVTAFIRPMPSNMTQTIVT